MKIFATKPALLIFCILFTITITQLRAQDTLNVPGVQAILYTGNSQNQPLVVALGGSEGGNAWASEHWKPIRKQFTDKGYALLAVGYFGCKGTPKMLDRISIEAVYEAIAAARKSSKVNPGKTAVVGGSRGGDLALLLGSYYSDINCVAAMSASHAVFPGNTQELNNSSWTFGGKELPFIPVNEEAVPFLMKRDLRGTFEAMLKDTAAEARSLIRVENIKGPVLLLSAKQDEIIPAVSMGEKMMRRMKNYHFPYHSEHLVYEGPHEETTKHFDAILSFLATSLQHQP